MSNAKFTVKKFVVGPIDVNCYILKDKESAEAIIIDPGDEGEMILDFIQKSDMKVKYIVNTHGHFDHIGADDVLRDALGAEVVIHEADAGMLTDAMGNLSAAFTGGTGFTLKPADKKLKDGDVITFGDCSLEVISTPGHTVGGICLYDGDSMLFSGDTLFQSSVGRTDLPGGNNREILKSVRERLSKISDNAEVYPGHGPSTDMDYERKTNPYLRKRSF